jgi:hypothetical protein
MSELTWVDIVTSAGRRFVAALESIADIENKIISPSGCAARGLYYLADSPASGSKALAG